MSVSTHPSLANIYFSIKSQLNIELTDNNCSMYTALYAFSFLNQTISLRNQWIFSKVKRQIAQVYRKINGFIYPLTFAIVCVIYMA